MPKIRHARTKKPPEGFEDIEPTLLEFARKMKDAENEPHEGKRRVESLWPIFRLHHQRSRYIYDLYYKREAITKEVYEYCIKHGYADGNLIAKWKKPGFERLCCLRCIQPKDTNFGTTCICRVPKSKLEAGRIVECVLCGCRGCSSTDFTSSKKEKSKQKIFEQNQDSSAKFPETPSLDLSSTLP
ncbi:23771_t:CDS:2 [Cetraspora pellucida]|uniref:23771_t:CDS:1 n=1 Tax=Cetraspora pellucida TaxID=1433469 RepID=A0A9N9CHH6_9GLOM|nr:23771_t:CDS:2 [Cetraspora pellucida]